MMRLSLRACLAVLTASPLSAQRSDGWSLRGHDLGGQRFSSLTAIDTATVRRLVPKWANHSGVSATSYVTVGGNALFGVMQGDIVMAFGLAE